MNVYIVMAHIGYGEDYSCKPVRAFESESEARKCAEHANHKAAFAAGVYCAYENIMSDWEKANPRPDFKGKAEYEAWNVREDARSKEVRAMLKFDELRADIPCVVEEADNLYYAVVELPLGGIAWSGARFAV